MEQEKKYKITEEEKKLLDLAKIRQTKDYKEQLKEERDIQIGRDELTIKQWTRELKFKEDELKKEEIVEKNEGMIDNLKKPFQLENEIEAIKFSIEDKKHKIDLMKKMKIEDLKNVFRAKRTGK